MLYVIFYPLTCYQKFKANKNQTTETGEWRQVNGDSRWFFVYFYPRSDQWRFVIFQSHGHTNSGLLA